MPDMAEGARYRVLLLLAPVILSAIFMWIPWLNSVKLHYTVLGVPRNASSEEITAAYTQIKSSLDLKDNKLQKVEQAFYVLSNPIRRRDYDNFGITIDKPWETDNTDLTSTRKSQHVLELNTKNFHEVLESAEPWIIQIYSTVSENSQRFSTVYEQIARVLEGQVKVGRVELGELELAKLLASKSWIKGPVFRQGIPTIVACPPGCKQLNCLARYSGELKYDSILDWIATDILELPRILYYSSQTLMPKFIQKSPPHKVHVIIFSDTGVRVAPYIREAAKKYFEHATFGCVLWTESEASIWKNRFGVESAPAIVFLKDPGVQPVVVYGEMNRTLLVQLMEEHKTHVLPQLRSVTASELGCDAAGYSLAGKDILTWYCVVTAGKPGYRLDQLRSTMRMVQDELVSEDNEEEYSAAIGAYADKRLSLSWLDGQTQKKFCYNFLGSETVHETCGERQYPGEEDMPRIFMIRFRRQANKQEEEQVEKPVWQQLFKKEEEDLASILVARYNGNNEVSEILSWISSTVRDGDSQDIPYFKTKKGPVLVHEESPTGMLYKTRSHALKTLSHLTEEGRNFLLDIVQLFRDHYSSRKQT